MPDLVELPNFLTTPAAWPAWEPGLQAGGTSLAPFQQTLKHLKEALESAFAEGVSTHDLVAFKRDRTMEDASCDVLFEALPLAFPHDNSSPAIMQL